MNTVGLQTVGHEKELYPKIKDILNVFQLYSESEEILTRLSDILEASLILIDSKGEEISSNFYSTCNNCSLLHQEVISMQSLLLNASNQMFNNCPFTDRNCKHQIFKRVRFFPFWKSDLLIGHLIVVTSSGLSAYQLSTLMEIVVIFLSTLFAREEDLDKENSNRRLQIALSSLTDLEKKIIFNIFQRIDKNENSLTIKIKLVAKEFEVAPSVINRGLKKLQSAGIIEMWSLSPKGTLLSIANKYLADNLDILGSANITNK